jgi:hypothetical protein
MNTNPINLAARFLLEIIMLTAFAYWSWHSAGGWLRYIAAIGLPLIAAVLWGVFRIPDDPKPAPVAVPGIVRLLLEWVLFGWAAWAMYDLGNAKFALIMGIVVVLHYAVSYDRTGAMLRNKPYKGFTNKDQAA